MNSTNNVPALLILFLAFIITTIPFSVMSEELTYAEAINKAGRQRMLTQRITNLYCQIGLDVAPKKSRQQLQDAINLFSSQLLALERFSTEQDVVEALNIIKSLWIPFKDLALTVPLQEKVNQLADMDEKLLMANEHLVQLLVNLSGHEVTRLVNISGRQRMLSQRLAKFYLLKSWGQGSHTMNSEIERATNEFSGALDALVQAPENTLLIKEKLESAKSQWAWFNSSIYLSNDEYFPFIVVDTSEKLLNIMEKITKTYQKIVIRDSAFGRNQVK